VQIDWEEIGVVCVSRPTNPTGNVLTDAEVASPWATPSFCTVIRSH
jgi:alanine-alpha-ketoisovalerate/valine-pyruvate aminotransferase